MFHLESAGTAFWHAVYTRHQHEKAVSQQLTSRGYEVFLPLHKIKRRWSDRSKVIEAALFPCYVFVRGPVSANLPILSTPGVHSFVQFAGRPAVISDDELEPLRRAIASNLGLEPHEYLNCGQWVRVSEGPLEGMRGVLVRKKSGSRMVVSVNLLHRSASIEIDGYVIEACDSGLTGTNRSYAGRSLSPSEHGQAARSPMPYAVGF
jgi:transcription antitermination factor NusG